MLRFVLLLSFVAAAASQIPYVMGLTRTSTASQEATLAMPPTSGKGAGITGARALLSVPMLAVIFRRPFA